MLNRRSLDPEQRTLYGANLQPPAGYVFDAAIATTFSLDFETALAVPVSLALFAAENRDDLLTHPLALLEGAERIAGRLIVFTDAGHIQAHTRPHSRLCSLLERIIVEVAAPNNGAFHPKMWALRFKPVRVDEPTRLRLLVLSRNLTRDRSWDIALTLDGVVAKRPQALNRPLVDFIRHLPDLATAGLPDGARALAEEFADDLRRTDWSLPDPFEGIAFAVNGLGGKLWRPEPCVRLGVISPFCDERALSMLADLAGANRPILIGRSDELALVPVATLDRFSRVAVLDEMAATEDGEEMEPTALQGLHAKVYIAERGWDTAITVGSGNATQPAFLSGSNVGRLCFTSLIGPAIMPPVNRGATMARAKQPKQIKQMTIAEWEVAFPDEDACCLYLAEHRWPEFVVCPRCGNPEIKPHGKLKWNWLCNECSPSGTNYCFSHIAGTIFENTNKPLRQWFRVIHLMLTSKKGISALQIHRMMGFGSYRTAWYMCHRIRAGMANEDFRKLMGIVEVDETFVGGLAKNRHIDKRGKGGGTGGTGSGKIPVVGAVQRKGKVVARVINAVDGNTLRAFVRGAVSEKVSLLCTDAFRGYRGLDGEFPHGVVDHARGQYVVGAIHTNTIEGFWSIFKRGVVGTFHKVSAKYLSLYVAEFQFRYNNRENADIFGEAIRGC